jgi:hypothetical protein
VHGGTAVASRARIDAVVAALAADGYHLGHVKAEYTIHDDRPALDAGWE